MSRLASQSSLASGEAGGNLPFSIREHSDQEVLNIIQWYKCLGRGLPKIEQWVQLFRWCSKGSNANGLPSRFRIFCLIKYEPLAKRPVPDKPSNVFHANIHSVVVLLIRSRVINGQFLFAPVNLLHRLLHRTRLQREPMEVRIQQSLASVYNSYRDLFRDVTAKGRQRRR